MERGGGGRKNVEKGMCESTRSPAGPSAKGLGRRARIKLMEETVEEIWVGWIREE